MLGKVYDYTVAFLMLFVSAGKWLWEQLWGTWDNVKSLFTGVGADDLLLPTIKDSLYWLFDQLPRAFGTKSPQEQVYASIVLGVATFFTGVVTGGAAWVIIFVWGVTLCIGLFRMIPAVNRQSERAQGPISKTLRWFRDLLTFR